jgi:glycine dehydrogenase
MIADLERWLAALTGYAAVSLQPNAGSQGELAGLLAIAAYHRSRGERHRDVCLIPASAHGTNAASAVMAGCGSWSSRRRQRRRRPRRPASQGREHRDTLAALMITYPSTHGVYEAEGPRGLLGGARRGRVRSSVDGAEPERAWSGWPGRGRSAADVAHLNLHKDVCIPARAAAGPGRRAGRGGAAHLAPFLPGGEGVDGVRVGTGGGFSARPRTAARAVLPIS